MCKQVERFCPALKRPKHGYFKCTTQRRKAGYAMGSKCRMRCRKGYKSVGVVRKKCLPGSVSWSGGGGGSCQPIVCPVLTAPTHGQVLPQSCSSLPSPVSTVCGLQCGQGSVLSGSAQASCGHKGEWQYPDGPTQCKASFPPPFIMCPPDQTKPLPPGSSSAYVLFSQPKTNVDWFR